MKRRMIQFIASLVIISSSLPASNSEARTLAEAGQGDATNVMQGYGGMDRNDLTLKPPPQCITCPNIIVRGKLAQVLNISECDGTSGMTCQVLVDDRVALPSRIQVQQLDTNGRVIGNKFLPYHDLKPGEKGHATFPIGSAATIVLVGEWKGHWRSSY